jgi:DNA polymerase III sliding clamp (beta) subunit (PCNA family)
MLIATMPLQHLIDAINWTAPSAEKDNDWRPMTCVRFTVGVDNPPVWDKNWDRQELPGVSLTATDRYRMSWSVIPNTDGNLGDGEFLIPAKDLLSAMKCWPKATARKPLTHDVSLIVFSDDSKTVEVSITDGDDLTLRQNLPLMDGRFPKCNGLIPDAKIGHPSFAVSPVFFKGFVDACMKVAGKDAPLRISTAGKQTREMMCFAPNADESPVRHSGLVMGVRIPA